VNVGLFIEWREREMVMGREREEVGEGGERSTKAIFVTDKSIPFWSSV
jgi:hypothetical protein